MSEERKYTAKEIEEMLALPCCHTSGTHDPLHYQDSKYVCQNQVFDAFERFCERLGINPVVKHKESCDWCQDYPEKQAGDGKEFWDRPNRCARCGYAKYMHFRGNYDYTCDDFVPTTYETMMRFREVD